jgi:hypothetical protein
VESGHRTRLNEPVAELAPRIVLGAIGDAMHLRKVREGQRARCRAAAVMP